jgi:hypothetical protein
LSRISCDRTLCSSRAGNAPASFTHFLLKSYEKIFQNSKTFHSALKLKALLSIFHHHKFMLLGTKHKQKFKKFFYFKF